LTLSKGHFREKMKLMKARLTYFSWNIAMLALLISCSGTLKTDGATGASAGAAAASTSSTTTPGLSGGLYFRVSTSWEGNDTDLTVWKSCDLSGTVTGAPLTSTCSVLIPEGQLHFSKLHFIVGTTNPQTCKRLSFFPYYYKLSNGAAYTPPWYTDTTTVDCSGVTVPMPVDCYDGAAPQILSTDFNPVGGYTGRYFMTAAETEHTYTIVSANSLLKPNNRYSSNNKTDPTAAVANYIANSMVNYTAVCYDEWDRQMYRMTIYVSDNDIDGDENVAACTPATSPTGCDDWDDWDAAVNP
jgi:hypothetical protein